MKFALCIVIGLASVAFIEAFPSQSHGDVYIRDHIKGLIELVKGEANKKIEELKQQKDDLMRKVRAAHGVVKEDLKKKLDEISLDLQDTYQELLQKIKDIFANNDESDTYFKDAVIEAIRELRVRITAKMTELAKILTDLATETSQTAKDHIREQREILMAEIQRIRDQLMTQLSELFRSEENIPEETYGFTRDVLDMLKEKAVQIKKRIDELSEQLKSCTEEQRKELMELIQALNVEFRGIMSDVMGAIREMMGKETSYAIGEGKDKTIDAVRELRKMVQQKLKDLKDLVDIAKVATGQANIEIRKAIDALQVELAQLKQELIVSFQEIFRNDQS